MGLDRMCVAIYQIICLWTLWPSLSGLLIDEAVHVPVPVGKMSFKGCSAFRPAFYHDILSNSTIGLASCALIVCVALSASCARKC